MAERKTDSRLRLISHSEVPSKPNIDPTPSQLPVAPVVDEALKRAKDAKRVGETSKQGP